MAISNLGLNGGIHLGEELFFLKRSKKQNANQNTSDRGQCLYWLDLAYPKFKTLAGNAATRSGHQILALFFMNLRLLISGIVEIFTATWGKCNKKSSFMIHKCIRMKGKLCLTPKFLRLSVWASGLGSTGANSGQSICFSNGQWSSCPHPKKEGT